MFCSFYCRWLAHLLLDLFLHIWYFYDHINSIYFPIFITSMYIWMYLFKYSWFLYIYLISSDFSKCSLSSNFCRFHMVFNLNNHIIWYWQYVLLPFLPLYLITDVFHQLLVSRLYRFHTMSWEMFFPLFYERTCINWYYFFLKCFMEFSGEAIWAWNFFVGKVLIKNSISLEDMGPFIFFISPVPLARFFQGIIHLSCWIY